MPINKIIAKTHSTGCHNILKKGVPTLTMYVMELVTSGIVNVIFLYTLQGGGMELTCGVEVTRDQNRYLVAATQQEI